MFNFIKQLSSNFVQLIKFCLLFQNILQDYFKVHHNIVISKCTAMLVDSQAITLICGGIDLLNLRKIEQENYNYKNVLYMVYD